MEQTQTVTTISFRQKISEVLQKNPIVLQILRFGAIGVFNTAMDALVLNYMSSQFGITKGVGIGWVNLPGFILAVIQSYYWNKYWAFGTEAVVDAVKNFLRLVAVGVVGVLIFGLVLFGGHVAARPLFFLGILIVFILAQVILWYAFGFFKEKGSEQHQPYLSFFIVSVIGFLINSLVLYLTTTHGSVTANAGDNLNIGKLAATAISLIWNFIGYKIFVFKK